MLNIPSPYGQQRASFNAGGSPSPIPPQLPPPPGAANMAAMGGYGLMVPPVMRPAARSLGGLPGPVPIMFNQPSAPSVTQMAAPQPIPISRAISPPTVSAVSPRMMPQNGFAPQPVNVMPMGMQPMQPMAQSDFKYGENEGVIQYSELSLGKVLGEGTFGIVYAGEFRSTPVAIKQLKVNTLTPKQVEEFMTEVKALREARHPNIVLFMGVSFNPFSIVTELLDTSLFNLLHTKKVQLSESQQLHIALCIARGVASLHQQKPPVMHRDLKSLNVLCTKDLVSVKLCDLGLIKMKANAKISSAAAAAGKEAVGTPIWMSPEVLADQPYDEKCDVYSFSMVLFEIVTGTVPFAPEIPSQQELLRRVAMQGERPRIPSTVRGRWSRLIQTCWATDPRLRPSMAEVVKTLQMFNQ